MHLLKNPTRKRMKYYTEMSTVIKPER